jgi:hypothetical protein
MACSSFLEAPHQRLQEILVLTVLWRDRIFEGETELVTPGRNYSKQPFTGGRIPQNRI